MMYFQAGLLISQYKYRYR